EGPQNARLAGVGVAHERAARALAAPEPLVRAVVRHVLQTLLQDRDLAADRAPVRLELGLARAPQPDAAADARQVRPHPGEARQLREMLLHLLRVGRPLARGADQKGALDGRLDVYELTDASEPPLGSRALHIR